MAVEPPTDPTDTLANFLEFVNEHDLAGVMRQFDNVDPQVGITNYGPQFKGFAQVQMLWRQIFHAFTKFSFDEQPLNVRLSSPPASPYPMISTQVYFTGQHAGAWFAKGTKWYSPPLSDIYPDGSCLMSLDACAIFTFNLPGAPAPNANKITQLALYFDRYLMAQQLNIPAQQLNIPKGSGSTGG